jgi:excisionase family DNA binding protein
MDENSYYEIPIEELVDQSIFASRKETELPIWERSILTVVEAAKYFQIGEGNIRKLTREKKDLPCIFWRDSHVFIRREEFEKFLDKINEI